MKVSFFIWMTLICGNLANEMSELCEPQPGADKRGNIEYSKCSKPVLEVGPPIFCPPLKSTIPIIEYMTAYIRCCLFRVDYIEWYYKRSTVDKYSLLNKTFYRNNREFKIRNPGINDGPGIYKCVGYYGSKNISRETELTLAERTADLDLEIKNISSDKNNLRMGSNVKLFCLIQAYVGWDVSYYWNFTPTNKPIIKLTNSLNLRLKKSKLTKPKFHGFTNLIKVNSSEINFFLWNFTLYLSSINQANEGYYECVASHTNTIKKREIHLELIKIQYFFYLFIALLLLIISSSIICYLFLYHIILMVKGIIKCCLIRKNETKKFNFVFLYNFEHDTEYLLINNIIDQLNEKGYRCYFYHRDQTYGRDILQDLCQALKLSEVVIVWSSIPLWSNPVFNFCMQMIIGRLPNLKRLYVTSKSKRNIQKLCNNKIVAADIQSCFTSNVYVWNINSKVITNKKIQNNLKKSNLAPIDQLRCHFFYIWLISSIPLGLKNTIGRNSVNPYEEY